MAGDKEGLENFGWGGFVCLVGVGWGGSVLVFNEGDWGQEATYKYRYLEDLQAGQFFIQPLVKLQKAVEKN